MATFDIAKLRQITLLYVEDESYLRKTEGEVYEKLFKKVYSAEDGIEALEIFNAHKEEIDVIVTDINMPRMNGLDFAKEVLKTSNIPIIITSAHSHSEFTTQAIKYGVKKYLIKPITINEIVQDIEEVVTEHHKEKKRLLVTRRLLTDNQKNTQEIEELLAENKKYEMENKQYKNIVDQFVATFMSDNKGLILETSKYFTQLLGYDEHDLVGKNINLIQSAHSNTNIKKMMLESIKTKSTVEYQYILKHHNGNDMIFLVTMVPFYSQSELVDGYHYYLKLVL